MKIIFICTRSLTFNTFLISQANFFKKNNIDVEVICSDNENLNFKRRNTNKINFPTSYLDLFNILNYIKIFFQIRKLVNRNKSNIFYIHTPIAAYLFRIFTFFYNLKIIYFVHGFRFTTKTNFFLSIFFQLVENILSFNTKVFLTINNEDYNYAKNKFSHNATVYKLNGVGISFTKKINFKNNNKNKIKKILVISAFKVEKGYLEILKIAKLIKRKKIRIDCFGYGDFTKFLLIKNRLKLNNIFFKKFDKNLKYKIKHYDLLLHLSKREGLPVSIIECLHKGIPVLCKNIRGNRDLVKNKYNGFFLNSYRDVPAIINDLNKNTNKLHKIKLNAIRSIKYNFSKDYINKKIYLILKKTFKF